MKNICFHSNWKVIFVFSMALYIAFPLFAQKIMVHGIVSDSAGEPLIGASIISVGTSSGTATDFDGKYQLSVLPTATLEVSYVGYQTIKVAVNGQKELNVVLQPSGLKLDEVVAIGYGTVKKTDATGSVATIKPGDIEAGLATSVQDLLVGQTPGVVVTTSAGPEGNGSIRIRGGSSLNASNDPLIVVDGVPLDNQGVTGISSPLSMIAPDNIQSMTILKDASATAIYGSRASNGVIIIVTKRGKSGRPQVNFSFNMDINTARKTWKVLNASQFSEKIKQYWGETSEAAAALSDSNVDWQDVVLHTTVSSNYNLSVGGTAGILPYRVAVNYTNNNGILKDSQMDRLSLGINLTPTFFDEHLSVNANAKGFYLRNSGRGHEGAVGAAVSSDPTRPVFKDYRMTDSSWGVLWNGYNSWMSNKSINSNATQNALSIIKDNDRTANIWSSNGNLQLDYKVHFLPEMHLNLNLGYDVAKADERSEYAQNSVSAWRNLNNNGAGYYYFDHMWKSNTLLDFYINYRKELESIKSMVEVTGGYSWQHLASKGWNNGNIFTTQGFQTPEIVNGAYSLVLDPNTAGAVGTRYTVDQLSADGAYNWRKHMQLLSFFGRVNCNFLDRYLLTVTVRGDASSRFSKDNRWGTFPSVALGWKLNEEKFMESSRGWLNELKLRLGWGITGQQDLGENYYPYLPQYQYAVQGSYYPSITGAVDANGNPVYATSLYLLGYSPDLKWEQTTTWNVGLDFSALNNRVNASLDYYYRKTKDLLSFVSVPAGSSTANMLNRNIGTLVNKGIEFSINARPIVNDNFKWSVNYSVAWNKNEITQLNDNNAYIRVGDISGGTGNTVQVHSVGHPAYSYYLYEQVYGQNGKPLEGVFVDQNNDGIINDNDKVINHSRDPKVIMTFGSTFNYKNWDFGFNLRASIGNYVYCDALSNRINLVDTWRNSHLSNLVKNDFYFERVGTINNYMSDYFLRNASYLRCDNITLGYTWNNLWKDMMKLRLYGAVQNPFVITKYVGIDPEIFDGIDRNVYPRPLTVSLGLIATF